ncbi:MAG: hypothetical protein J6N51_14475 [Selenomonas sp.]|nr:hypothetical protein [Selenomonas sp.]
MFKDMTTLLQDRKKGNAEIQKFTISPYDFRAIYLDHLIEGKEYVRLMVDNEIMMSDAPMEQISNEWVVENAHGDMLIAGLGIGLILLPIMEKVDVTSVIVVETNQNIIDIVAPQLQFNKKVKIIHGNIFEYTPNKQYDCIYFDIWPTICRDNAGEMESLMDKFGDYLKDSPNVWMKCWQEDYVLGYCEEIVG